MEGALLTIGAWAEDDIAACAIIKHTTPCGLAVGSSPEEAYRKALSTDPTSAFGSVVAFNWPVTEACAEEQPGQRARREIRGDQRHDERRYGRPRGDPPRDLTGSSRERRHGGDEQGKQDRDRDRHQRGHP